MDGGTTQPHGKIARLQQQARATVPTPTEERPPPTEKQPLPPPNYPPPKRTAPPVQVVEPTPIIKAIERLHQTVGDEMATVTRFTQVQGDYLVELKRAQNALTSDWYRIAAQVPQVQSAMHQLENEIRQRQREMAARARLMQRVAAAAVAVMVLAAVVTVGVLIVIARRHL